MSSANGELSMSKAASSDRSRVSVAAALAAIAFATLAILLLAILHALSPEFDPSWRMVSEYANGHYSWVLSLMFATWAFSQWALAFAIWPQTRRLGGRIGIGLLTVAGAGTAMASIFDINHPLHDVAGALGVIGLPIAAVLISLSLSPAWPGTKRTLLWAANLTWGSVVLLGATFALMIVTYVQSGHIVDPQAPVTTLPAGVIALVGWANRLLVVVYCGWVMVVAWLAIRRRGQPS
jgi:hypothetical membrane protein